MMKALKSKISMFVLVAIVVVAGLIFSTFGLNPINKVYAALPDGSDVTFVWENEDGSQISTETQNLSKTSEEFFASVPTPTPPTGSEYVSYTFSHWAGSDGNNYATDEIPSFNHYFQNDVNEVTFTAVFNADYNKELHLEGSASANLPTSTVDGEEVIVLEYGTENVTVITNYSITHNDGIAALLLIPEYNKNLFKIEGISINGTLVYGAGATSNKVFNTWSATVTGDGESDLNGDSLGTGTEVATDAIKILIEGLPASQETGELFVQIIYSMTTFQSGNHAFGFVTDYSNGASNDNRSQAYGVLMEDAIAEFNEVEIVAEDIIIKIIDRTNEEYTVTFMVSIDGKEYIEYNVVTTAKFNDLIEDLYVLEDFNWFRSESWYIDEARKTLATTVPSGGTTVYGAYIFDIGKGDVNGDRFITTDDIMLYRQWIVGGYDMEVVEEGAEWEFVNNNTIHSTGRYFLTRVADPNLDLSKDIRDITTIRMSLVGGYGYNVSQGIQNLAKVTGQAVVAGRDVQENSDFVIGSYVGTTINTGGTITEIVDGSWTIKINPDGTFALGLGNGQLLEGSWERPEGVEYENSNYITLLAYVDGEDVSWVVYDAKKENEDNYYTTTDILQLYIDGSYITFEREGANFGEEELQFSSGRHDAFIIENRTEGYRFDLSSDNLSDEALQYANSYIYLSESGDFIVKFTDEMTFTGTWTPEMITISNPEGDAYIYPTEDENSPIYFENGRLAVKMGDSYIIYKRTTWGDEQLSEEGFTYITVNEKVYIVGVPEGSGALTIPSTLTVEEGIGGDEGMETVSAMTFGNQITRLETSVMPRVNYKLLKVYGLGNGTETINNLNGYTNIVISEDIISIQPVAFAGSTIESISIPSTIVSVGEYAFSGIATLEKFAVSGANEKYQTDGRSLLTENGTILLAYANMSGESYTVPTGVVLIEQAAMAGSSELKELTLSSTVKHLRENALEECENLEKIILKGDLQEIYGMRNLFLNKDGKKSYLGALLYDGEYFFGTPSSAELVEGKVYYSQGDAETKTGYGYKLEAGNIYIVSVPEYVAGETSTTLTIPSILETEQHGTISIYGVLSINNYEGYKHLVFENGIVDLMPAMGGFMIIDGFESVSIPESITDLVMTQKTEGFSVEMTAFAMAMDMKQFIVAEGNPTYKALEDGKILASKDGKIAYVYAAGTGEESISIPEGVERIAGYAIANKSNITEINLPSTLKSIGFASLGGTGIQSIEFPEGFERIDPLAFMDCSVLNEIILNSELETGLMTQLLTAIESTSKMWLHNGFPVSQIQEEGVYTFEEIDIFDIALNVAQAVFTDVSYEFRVNPLTYSVDWYARTIYDQLGRVVTVTNNRFIVAGTTYKVDWDEKQVLQDAVALVPTTDKTTFVVDGVQYVFEDDGVYKFGMKAQSINGGWYRFADGITCLAGMYGFYGETSRYSGDFGHIIDWENRTVSTSEGRSITTYNGYFDDDGDVSFAYYVDWEERVVYQIQYSQGTQSSIAKFDCGGDVYYVDWGTQTITSGAGDDISVNSNNLFKINGNYWEIFWEDKKIIDNNGENVSIVGNVSQGFGVMIILGDAYIMSVPTCDGENLTLTIPATVDLPGYGTKEVKGILTLENSEGYKNLVISEGIKRIGLGMAESDMELYMENALFKDIETVSIPSTLTSMHFGQTMTEGEISIEILATPFVNTPTLKQITIAEVNPKYATNENGTMLLSKDGKTLYFQIMTGEEESIIVPDGVKKVATMAFTGANVKEIIIPNSVTNICMAALMGVNIESLETIYLSSNLGTTYSMLVLVPNNEDFIFEINENVNIVVVIDEELTEDIFVESEMNAYLYITQIELEVDLDKARILPTIWGAPWIKDGKVVTHLKEAGTYTLDRSVVSGGGEIETVYSVNGDVVLDGVEYVVDLSNKSIYDLEGNLIAGNLNDYDDLVIGGKNITIDFYGKTLTDNQGNQIVTEDQFYDNYGNKRFVNWQAGTVSDWYGNVLSEYTIEDGRWVVDSGNTYYVEDSYSRVVVDGRNYIINWYSNYIEDYYNGDEYSYNTIWPENNQVVLGGKQYEVRWRDMQIVETSNWSYHDINFNGYAVSYYQGKAYISAVPKFDGTTTTLTVPATLTINEKQVKIYGVASLNGYEGYTDVVISEGIVAFGGLMVFGVEPFYMGIQTLTIPASMTEVAPLVNLEGIEAKIFPFISPTLNKFIIAEGNPSVKTDETGKMLLSIDGTELHSVAGLWSINGMGETTFTLNDIEYTIDLENAIISSSQGELVLDENNRFTVSGTEYKVLWNYGIIVPKTIKVPDTVKEIGSYSMLMIYGDELVLSANLEKISPMMCGMCDFTKIVIPQEAPLTEIPMYSFMEVMVKELVLSENIKTIGEGGLAISGFEKITLTGSLEQPYAELQFEDGKVLLVDGVSQAPYIWGAGEYVLSEYDPTKLMEGQKYYISNGTVNLGGVDYVVDFATQTLYDPEGNPITLDGNNCFCIGATELTVDWYNRMFTDSEGNPFAHEEYFYPNGKYYVDWINHTIRDEYWNYITVNGNQFMIDGYNWTADWENRILTQHYDEWSSSDYSYFTSVLVFEGTEYEINWDNQYLWPTSGGEHIYSTDGKIYLGGQKYEVRIDEGKVIDKTYGWNEIDISVDGYSVQIYKGKAYLLSVPSYTEGSLTTLTIPNSIYFEGVGNLEIYGVASIKGYEGYTDLVFSEGIVDIASGLMISDEPMMGLFGIETITIPASMTEIVFSIGADGMVLEGAGIMMLPSLKKIIVAQGNPSVKTNEDGTMLLSKDGKQFLMYAAGIETTKVVIPEGVEKTYAYALGYAMFVEEVVLPSTLKTIGTYSFGMCAIKEITIPKSLKSLESYAFIQAFNLTKVSFEEGIKLKEIAEGAFSGTMIETIIIPEGVTKIGFEAFKDCSNLKFVSLPTTLTLIKGKAFENCSSLTGIILSDGVIVEENAFRNCSSLTTLVLDGNNIQLDTKAFGTKNDYQDEVYLTTLVLTKNATKLFEFSISNNFLKQEDWAKEITTIYIEERLSVELDLADPSPSSIEDTENMYGRLLWNYTSFSGISSINNIGRSAGVYYGAVTKNIFDVQFYDKDGNPAGEPVTVVRGTSISAPEITVPSGYTLTWSDNIEQINSENVYPIWTLTTNGAWTADGKYQYWTPDDGTTWYISGASESALENGTLTIPTSLLIGENSDNGHSSTTEQTIQIAGVAGVYYYRMDLPATEHKVVISDGISEIKQNAFKDAYVTSIEIPESVTKIGANAFAGTGLTSIEIPAGVTEIGKEAFANCLGLTEVTINGNFTIWGNTDKEILDDRGHYIGYVQGPVGAFQGSNYIKVLNIGSEVTELPENLFNKENLFYVDTIIIEEGSTLEIELPSPLRNGFNNSGRAEWHKGDEIVTQTSGAGTYVVTIVQATYETADGWQYQYDGENWWIIGVPTGGGELTIPSELVTTETFGTIQIYGVKSNSAYGMSRVAEYSSIVISDGIKAIGQNAFANCKKIESLTINSNLESVEILAFSKNNIKTLYIGDSVTSIPQELFDESNLYKINKIVVAEGSALTENLPSRLTNSIGNIGEVVWIKEGEGVVTEFGGAGTYNPIMKDTTYQTADGWQYQFDGENWWIIGAPEGTGKLTIPSELATTEWFGTIDIHGIMSINGFEGINNISSYQSVVISNGIKVVGEYSLTNENLTEITIDSNLDSFDSTATDSTGLTKLVIGNNVTSLPVGLIGELLPYIQTVENQAGTVSNSHLPETVLVGTETKDVVWFTIENGQIENIATEITSGGAFTTVFVDQTYTTADGWQYQFDGEKWWIVGVPSGSGTITIPNAINLTEFGTLDIYGIKQKESSGIPNLSRYSSVIISDGIEELGEGMFTNIYEITSLTLNGNVQTFNSWLFNGEIIKTLIIGSGVTSLPENIFEILPNLTTITCNSEAFIGTALPEVSKYGASWIGPERISVEQITGVGTYTISGAVYVVTFLDENGEELSRQEVEFGRGISTPEATKEGYRLLGWFTDPSDETTQVKSFISIKDHLTVYAKYIEQRTITVERVTGYGDVSILTKYYNSDREYWSEIYNSTKVDINSTHQFKISTENRSGYYIASIYVNSEKVLVTVLRCEEQIITIPNITEDTTIRIDVKWSPSSELFVPEGAVIPEDYDMTGIRKVIVEADMETAFTRNNQNGLVFIVYKDGVAVDAIQEAGEYTIVYPGTIVETEDGDEPTEEQHEFSYNGWKYMSDGENWWIIEAPSSGNHLTIPNILVTNIGAIDIYGVKSTGYSYVSNSKYITIEDGIEVIGENAFDSEQITIKGNVTSVDENAFSNKLKQIISESENLSMQLPTVVGGKAVTWENEAGIEVTEITSVGTYTIRYSLTVQFVGEDREMISVQQVLYGRDAIVPEMEAREGYRFGWFTDAKDKSTQVTDFTNITEHLTVHAVYIKIYNVTFIDKDGNQIGETQVVDSGEPAVVPETELEGHTFLGWFKDVNDSSSEVTDFSSITEDITVKALYEIHKFSISTSVEGGTAEFSEHKVTNGKKVGGQYTYGSNVSILINPTGDYGIYKIFVDGEEIEFELRENGTFVYTFNNVTEDHTISVKLAIWIPVEVGDGTYNAQYIGKPTTATIPEGQLDGKDWVAIDTEGGRWNELRIIEVPDSVAEKVNGTTLPAILKNNKVNGNWLGSRTKGEFVSKITSAGSYLGVEYNVEIETEQGYRVVYDPSDKSFGITYVPETIDEDGIPTFVFNYEHVISGTNEAIGIRATVIKATKSKGFMGLTVYSTIQGVSKYSGKSKSINIIIEDGITKIENKAFANLMINNLYLNSNVENNSPLAQVFDKTQINRLTLGVDVDANANKFLMDLFGATEVALNAYGVDYGDRRNDNGQIIAEIVLEKTYIDGEYKHPYFLISGPGNKYDEFGLINALYGINPETGRTLYFVIGAGGIGTDKLVILHGAINYILGMEFISEFNITPAFANLSQPVIVKDEDGKEVSVLPLLVFASMKDGGTQGDLSNEYYVDDYKDSDGKVYRALYRKKGSVKNPKEDYILWRNAMSWQEYWDGEE